MRGVLYDGGASGTKALTSIHRHPDILPLLQDLETLTENRRGIAAAGESLMTERATRTASKATAASAPTHEQILELIDRVSSAGIEEVVFESGDFRLRVVGKRSPKRIVEQAGGAAPASLPAAATTTNAAPAAPAPATEPPTPEEDADDGLRKITAPMIGTFYRAPAPDAPHFVEVGDRIQEDTVLCIVEAMKLMNEIKAEVRGVVRKIYVENGQPVEYGQPIFGIEPS